MKIGVVIPTLGVTRDLRIPLSAWQAQTDRNFHLLVVLDTVGHVPRALNEGFWAMSEAECDAVTFQADDVLPDPDFIKQLRHAFQSEPVALVDENPENAEPIGQPDLVEFTLTGGVKALRPWGFQMVTWAARADLLRRANCGNGPWDEAFKGAGYRADTDLAWRLLKLGAIHYFHAPAIVCHPEGGHTDPDLWCERRLARQHPLEYFDRINVLHMSEPGYYQRVREKALREREG